MSVWEAYHSHRLLWALGLTAAVPLLRYLLHTLIFKPLGTQCLAETKQQRQSGILPPKADHRRKKLTESLWKLTAYVTLLSLGTRALYDKPWAVHTAEWWRGYPNQALEPTVELYYMAELAFYGASLLMLLLWEERRHDFIVMMAHHLVTITLIAFSYITKYTRIGAVVMILHDPSDICLEAAKLSQYVGHENLATFWFSLLVISWFTLRILFFPFWLVRSALVEPPEILGDYPPKSLLFVAMLCSLVCMHVYWFALIANIAWATIATGRAKDTREDDD